MAKLNDIKGKQFGNWLVLYRNGSTKNKASIWRCRCLLCGSEKDVVGQSLTNGSSTKCRSCVPKLTLAKPNRKNRIYNIYNGIKQRCLNPSSASYNNYGGKGVRICDEWLSSPDAFIDWALSNGYNDSLSIDRIDPTGNYEPSNCHFTTTTIQNRNKTTNINISFNGEVKCLSEMCREYGVNYNSVRSAHRRGESYEEAFYRLLNSH